MADIEIDLDELGEVYLKILRKTFFHILRKKHNKKVTENQRKILKFLLPTIAYISMFTYILLQSLFINNIVDFSQKMINIAIIFNVLSVIIRLVVFCVLTDKMESLFLNFESFHCNHHREFYAVKVLNIAYAQSMKINFWATILFASNCTIWLIAPMIANKDMLNLITGHSVTYKEWLVNVPSTLPFEVTSPWKELRFLFEITNAIIANTIWLSSDIICYAIVNLLKAQFKILSESIIRIDYSTNTDTVEPMCYKYFVEDHNELIKVSKTLEEFLSPILASQLLATGVLLGGILLIVTSGPESEVNDMSGYIIFYMKFLIYMAVALLELYLFCWLSSLVKYAYEDVGNAIYNSDWFLKLDREAQYSHLSIQIAQKGLNITAFKLVKIDLRTFIEVLRLSYTYFTLMKQGIRNGNDEI